ncbi:MAG: hydrogenase iron-sulfur subunit [Planctomycetota bacterium]|nr:hydrogenase iron-sulfur subunit [Planctomycetota bacterium]
MSDNHATPPPAPTDDDYKIIAFCCNFCAYAAADLAGARRMQYPANVRVVHLPCTGKLEMDAVLAAFERGIDGVLVAGCLEGGCHYLEGNLRAKRRLEAIRNLLDEIGLGRDRLLMVNLSAAMAPTFVERVQEMVATVKRLGPNPLRVTANARGVAVPAARRPEACTAKGATST